MGVLLNLLGLNQEYERCRGSELYTKDGRRILDFLSGYCVHNPGHNHPYIVEALKDELDKVGPAMLQSHVPELAGALAERLCELAGGGLRKVYFGSSGSEGVEAAIKFARATTGRTGIVYAQNGFHGLTAGALSLMSDEFWREGFGPLLPDFVGVPFDDLAPKGSEHGAECGLHRRARTGGSRNSPSVTHVSAASTRTLPQIRRTLRC
jgi:ornithine--oxo-acid transaminase